MTDCEDQSQTSVQALMPLMIHPSWLHLTLVGLVPGTLPACGTKYCAVVRGCLQQSRDHKTMEHLLAEYFYCLAALQQTIVVVGFVCVLYSVFCILSFVFCLLSSVSCLLSPINPRMDK